VCHARHRAAPQGLRTFEIWVDNLNPEYLEKALSDVMQDVMAALWALLRPSQPVRPHAMAAMTLLGKLGARGGRMRVRGCCTCAVCVPCVPVGAARTHMCMHTHMRMHTCLQPLLRPS
jgi:hypothetical protein